MKLTVVAVITALAAMVPAGADPLPPSPADRLPSGGIARSLAPAEEGVWQTPAGLPLGERGTEIDNPDAEPGVNQTHVMYFVPRDKPDESFDDNGTLSRALGAIRDWFVRETTRNGLGARRPRFDRLTSGGYDISFVRGNQDAAAYTQLSVITDEISARGFNVPTKRYLIFAAVSRGGICGEAFYPLPGFPLSGRYAAVYLDSDQSCGAREFGSGTASTAARGEAIAAHEWLHNEGVASLAAPHHCAVSRYHVCTAVLALLPGDLDPEAPDIVFPYINAPLSAKVLDRDLDDYLDHVWPHIPNLRASAWLE